MFRDREFASIIMAPRENLADYPRGCFCCDTEEGEPEQISDTQFSAKEMTSLPRARKFRLGRIKDGEGSKSESRMAISNGPPPIRLLQISKRLGEDRQWGMLIPKPQRSKDQ
ncbi:MAG: hypothetical protein CL912_18800 [Deltaproteobacteria bacterium]|nr:hypothetical protein [Deltaproteobacteria bacterium]